MTARLGAVVSRGGSRTDDVEVPPPSFTVDASPSNALHVFYHPFAYGIAKA